MKRFTRRKRLLLCYALNVALLAVIITGIQEELTGLIVVGTVLAVPVGMIELCVLKCPHCGTPMGRRRKGRCPYCGRRIDLD